MAEKIAFEVGNPTSKIQENSGEKNWLTRQCVSCVSFPVSLSASFSQNIIKE